MHPTPSPTAEPPGAAPPGAAAASPPPGTRPRPPLGPEPPGPAWRRTLVDPDDRRRAVWPALGLAVFELVGTFGAAQGQPEARDLGPLAVALVLAAPVALVWRRTHPRAVLGVAFVAGMAYLALDYPKGPIFLGMALAYVNAVVRGRRRLAVSLLAAGYVLAAWVVPAFGDGSWPDRALVGGLGAWLLVLGSASELIRVHLERAAARDAARAEEARRRMSDERLRIARELHDVLAHDISLISVRAGVALHLLDERPDSGDPTQVHDALTAIREASRDALGELRSVLDVLRQGDDAAPLAPTAGLDDLDALVERARGTGLDVRVERLDAGGRALDADGLTVDLPAGVGLAAFRIVQEALTNVVRHAGASRASVRIRRTATALEVRVDDDGGGLGDDPRAAAALLLADPRGEGGRGIAGMRERALALGGSAEAGPRPGRGFRVQARLPLPGVAGPAAGPGAGT